MNIVWSTVKAVFATGAVDTAGKARETLSVADKLRKWTDCTVIRRTGRATKTGRIASDTLRGVQYEATGTDSAVERGAVGGWLALIREGRIECIAGLTTCAERCVS